MMEEMHVKHGFKMHTNKHHKEAAAAAAKKQA